MSALPNLHCEEPRHDATSKLIRLGEAQKREHPHQLKVERLMIDLPSPHRVQWSAAHRCEL